MKKKKKCVGLGIIENGSRKCVISEGKSIVLGNNIYILISIVLGNNGSKDFCIKKFGLFHQL